MTTTLTYNHKHGKKRYCLVYEIGCRLHRHSHDAFRARKEARYGRCSWTATLEEAWDVTGLDPFDPDEEERGKAVRLEDLPSRPTEQDVLDEESEF